MIYGYELIKYFSENEDTEKESSFKKIVKGAKTVSKVAAPTSLAGAVIAAGGYGKYISKKIDSNKVAEKATDNILKRHDIYDKDGNYTKRGENLRDHYISKIDRNKDYYKTVNEIQEAYKKNNKNISPEEAEEIAKNGIARAEIKKNLFNFEGKNPSPRKELKKEIHDILEKDYNLSKKISKAATIGGLAGAGIGLSSYGGYKLYKYNKNKKQNGIN